MDNHKSALAERPVILFGGTGSERLVSVASAQNLCIHLPEAGLWFWHPEGACFEIDAQALRSHQHPFETEFPVLGRIAFAKSIDEALVRARDERRTLVLALHGGRGEDGSLAAECEALAVPFTGSGSKASQTAFDKLRAKHIASRAGVPTLPALDFAPGQVDKDGQTIRWLEQFGALVAKPVCDGSSHGLRFLKDRAACEGFIQEAREHYMIEPFAQGIEATVGVIELDSGTQALEPVEICVPTGANFDYAGKYLDPSVRELCPSTFTAVVVVALKQYAVAVHRAIGAEGYSRSDFIVQTDGAVFLEINTLPGLTAASLLPLELEAGGIGMREFLRSQIKLACERSVRRL